MFFLEFDFGSIASNLFGAALNTAIGKDCKGRPQGDYFFGCQVNKLLILLPFTYIEPCDFKILYKKIILNIKMGIPP